METAAETCRGIKGGRKAALGRGREAGTEKGKRDCKVGDSGEWHKEAGMVKERIGVGTG